MGRREQLQQGPVQSPSGPATACPTPWIARWPPAPSITSYARRGGDAGAETATATDATTGGVTEIETGSDSTAGPGCANGRSGAAATGLVTIDGVVEGAAEPTWPWFVPVACTTNVGAS